MGYGWVLFEFKEVAITAAQTINGYIMYGKQIIAKYVDPKDTTQKVHSYSYIYYLEPIPAERSQKVQVHRLAVQVHRKEEQGKD